MLGIILGALALIGIIVAVVCCVAKTPINLQGFYGGMFWTIATIAIVAIIALVVVGIL
jgi:hypothetical protein